MVELDEQWVAIEGYPNYQVSNFGNVENINTGRELKPYKMSKGLLQVKLSKNSVSRSFYVHRLVAQAFFLNYQEGVMVLFKNGNVEDCGVFNLTLGKGCRKRET